MRNIYTFLFSILILFALPAAAQESPFKGGMQHIKAYSTNNPKQTETEYKSAKKKTRVWNKYKSLAAGKDEQTNTEETAPDSAKEIEPVKTIQPQAQTQELPTRPKPNAMGMLLQEYRRNKEQRKDIKSLSFSKPEALNTRSKNISGTEE